jgi:hypothetical protein
MAPHDIMGFGGVRLKSDLKGQRIDAALKRY